MKKKTRKKLIRFPIELAQRELYPKIYLALKFAKAGYQALIYDYNNKPFERIKGGVYFYKDHAENSKKRFYKKKCNGSKVVAFDEEGLIYLNENVYARTRCSKDLLDSMDAVFLWGDEQASIVKKISDYHENKHVVGSYKFDIYNLMKQKHRPASDQKAIRVLINTRFVLSNSKKKNSLNDHLERCKLFVGPIEKSEFLQMVQDDVRILECFDDLIKKLAKRSNVSIVIRPHPAEDFEFYMKYKELSRYLSVDGKPSLTNQIMDADFLIHDGCTTAIESNAMGVPCLGLRPPGLKNPPPSYANSYSLNFDSPDSLISYVVNNHGKNVRPIKVNETASKRIANWDGRSSAISRIVEKVDSLDVLSQKKVTPSLYLKLDYNCDPYYILYWFAKKSRSLRRFLKWVYNEKYVKLMSIHSYEESKYPLLEEEKVLSDIREICQIDNELSFEEFEVRFLTSKSILIDLK